MVANLTGSTRQSATITYFSFTSTPNAKCLEMFGHPTIGRDLLSPFHTYSMAEALRLTFITKKKK